MPMSERELEEKMKTPVKTIVCERNNRTVYICPVCGHEKRAESKNRTCSYCGQKLV